ncbi:MAG: type VI secretion system baseplate subunit TssG [Betaproteobacteria bacterium]|nr:type VI secretion system baseplate subunit TssG [Betaproteobacteria bacterium]
MAGQIGQNGVLTDTSRSISPLMGNMLEMPGKFAFAQVVSLLLRHMREQGMPADVHNILFRVNPNLSFPPADVEQIEFVEGEESPHRVSVMMNLMGLHGASSPLPSYFTDYIAQNQDDPDALRDFFDVFNHRLVETLYRTGHKYRYYAQYEFGALDRMSARFFSFMGMGHLDLREAKKLNWPRLMAYMGLIAFQSESAGSLESILRHYFLHEDICIRPCILRWVDIPQGQQCLLGQNNTTLHTDFLLGNEVPDQTGKFRVCIGSLDWGLFNEFLPCGNRFGELYTLVQFVLRSRLEFDVELHLHPEEIPPWTLEEHSRCLLGWSVWNGEGGDGIVVLEPKHEELNSWRQ